MLCECIEPVKEIVHEIISKDYVRNITYGVQEYKCTICGLYNVEEINVEKLQK